MLHLDVEGLTAWLCSRICPALGEVSARGRRAHRAQAAGAAVLHRHEILLIITISLLAGCGSSSTDLFLI